MCVCVYSLFVYLLFFLQLSNFTPTGMLFDRVLLVNGVVKKKPVNMWQDVIISEGVKDDITTMNAVVDATPRDKRTDGAQKWTTTDENGTNERNHATCKQIHGSFLQLLGIARNLPYSYPVALRWLHLVDAHFPMASNSLTDFHSLHKQRKNVS